jgi:H+/Cl- antiporter ClcA
MLKLEYLAAHFKKNWTQRHYEENLPFISVGILAAIVCSLYALLFAGVEHFSLAFFTNNPLLMFIFSPLMLVVSFLLVKKFAPGSSGSGIPQVMACIDKPHRHLSSIFLRKSVITIKVLSSLAAVFAGAAIGREGPSLQISAAIANNVGQFFQKFNIKIKMDQLLITGAAGGLAAAFNTPIGGIVYAIEELSQDHIRSFKDVLLISVVISGLTAQLITGNYLYLGVPEVLTKIGLSNFCIIALVSLVAGILGALFSKCLTHLLLWRSSKTFRVQILIIIGVGLLVASSFYFLDPRTVYSGKESINHILFSKGEIPFHEFGARFILPIFSSMTGIAGGIFAPSLSAGASFGGFVSTFFDPSMRTILGITGMVGFLTGVTRTPITSFVLVLEMTNRHSAVFPMILASVLSTLGAYLVSDKSFYEESLELIKEQDLASRKDSIQETSP